MTATLTKKSQKEAERQEAIRELRRMLKPGDTVYTVCRHVSASGMSRRIDAYVIRKGDPVYISGYVGKVLDYRRSRDKEFRMAIHQHLRSLEVKFDGDSARAYAKAIVKAAECIAEEIKWDKFGGDIYAIGEAHLLASKAATEGVPA